LSGGPTPATTLGTQTTSVYLDVCFPE
jgi:hypothetical protein